MGTPLPANEPATGCALCFGSGKPLGDVQPTYVICTFDGVKPGAVFDVDQHFIPHGPFTLTHISDCLYRKTTSQYQVTMNWGATRTLTLFSFPGGEADGWAGPVGKPCDTVCDEDAGTPVGRTLFAGTVTVTWNTEGL